MRLRFADPDDAVGVGAVIFLSPILLILAAPVAALWLVGQIAYLAGWLIECLVKAMKRAADASPADTAREGH